MSGNEVDEAARNWPQLMALMMQLLQRIQRASADGSIRLNRADYKQFVTEWRDAQKLLHHEITITRAWYQARTEEYQRESRAATARAAAGQPVEEQSKAAAYLSGLRAGIEHTVHNTVLTAEQRGQVVQTLDAIDADSSKPLARNIFQPVAGNAAVRARYAAAESEHKVAQHREQLTQTTTATAVQPSNAELAKLRQDSGRRFDDLAGRLDRLEDRFTQLWPQQAAAATATNGHGVPNGKPKARQSAQYGQQQHVDAPQGNGVGPSAEAAAEAGQNHQTAPQRPTATQGQQASAQAGPAAQMQAEA